MSIGKMGETILQAYWARMVALAIPLFKERKILAWKIFIDTKSIVIVELAVNEHEV